MRLIDADKLIEVIDEIDWFSFYKGFIVNGAECEEKALYKAVDIIAAVDTAPTVDAVPVVRCRDCKHYHDFETHFDCSHPYGMDCVGRTDFCSYGERRDDDAVH